jgi:hypothetical protein
MAFSSNAPILQYNSLDTFPLSEALTGTATSTGTIVVGVGTLFTTEIGYNGDDNSIVRKPDLGYIWNGNDEWRQVTDVISDTLLYIESAFTTPLAATDISRIPTCRATMVEYYSNTATGTIDGVDIKFDEFGTWKISEFTNKPIQPHIINGTSGAIVLTITY